MPRAYSEDLRRRVVADTDKGLSMRAVAEQYAVSLSFVSKWTRVGRHEGAVAGRQVGGDKRHVLAEHADAIRHQLAEQNGMTLGALRDWAQAAPGMNGLELCRKLRASSEYSLVLMVTAKSTELDPASRGDEIDKLQTTFSHMAELIRQHVHQLKETDQFRRELVANVSHDLRTPVTSLQGYLKTLLWKEGASRLRSDRSI